MPSYSTLHITLIPTPLLALHSFPTRRSSDLIPPKDSRVPSWHFRNPDPYSITSMPRSFLQMAFSTSRLSVTNLIYGIQGLHWMAGIALQNSADFLSEYPVVQFYWFPTDTQGHFNGEET